MGAPTSASAICSESFVSTFSGSRSTRLLHVVMAKLQAEFAARFLPLDEGFEPRQGLIPLSGNAIEVSPDVLERFRPQFEQAFASDACALHHAGAFEHAQVLGDRLPRQA